MTKDGTFRIRDGKVAEPLVNLRFTVALPDVLADVPGLTREPLLVNQNELYDDRYPFAARVPGYRHREVQHHGYGLRARPLAVRRGVSAPDRGWLRTGGDAERALAALRDLAEERALVLKDAALVVKDDAGHVELRQSKELAAGESVVSGGSIGLLLGLAIGVPVAAALLGLAGGGGLAMFDRGISDDRMRRFGEELDRHAALFALVADVDWAQLHERLALRW